MSETIYILGLGVPVVEEPVEPLPPVLKVISPSKSLQGDSTNRQLFTGDQPCVLHHLHLWVWPRRHREVDLCWTQASFHLVKQDQCMNVSNWFVFGGIFLQAKCNGGAGEEDQEPGVARPLLQGAAIQSSFFLFKANAFYRIPALRSNWQLPSCSFCIIV